MANICSFEMKIRGNNVEGFLNAMQQKGDIYMGRGASFKIDNVEDDVTTISGDTKWSLEASLISDAYSMATQKEKGSEHGMWYDGDGFISNHDFLDIFECAKKFEVEFEAISEEPGCGFQEHLAYVDGEVINESSDGFIDIWFDSSDYETKEEAEKEFDIEISNEEFAEGNVRRETEIGEQGFDYF